MKKTWAFGRIPTWPVQDGFSISVFEDLYLWYTATEHERTWKQNERTWMQHERKWMLNERNMWGNECEMKSDERKWKQQMTSVDSRPRMLSHPQKVGKFTLLVYRKLTTWENDKSKQTITWFWKSRRIRGFMQPQMLFFYVQAFYKNPAVMYGW